MHRITRGSALALLAFPLCIAWWLTPSNGESTAQAAMPATRADTAQWEAGSLERDELDLLGTTSRTFVGQSQDAAGADDLLEVWNADLDTPVAGAQLLPWEQDSLGGPVADEHGLVSLPSVRAGSGLEVHGPGVFPVRLTWEEFDALERHRPHRRLELNSATNLFVEVVTPSGAPCEDVFVRVLPIDPRSGLPAGSRPAIWPIFATQGHWTGPASALGFESTTDASGRLEIPMLPCGRELLVVGSRTTSVQRANVLLRPGVSTATVQLTLPDRCNVTGRLAWSDGTPAAAVFVELTGLEAADIGRVLNPTDPSGRFWFQGISEGELILQVESPGVLPRPVVVEAPLTDLGTLVIPRARTLWGQLEFSRRHPDSDLAGLSVSAFQEGTVLDRARTGPAGTFELNVLGASVTVAVEMLGRGELFRSELQTAGSELTIPMDDSCGGLELTLPEGTGTVSMSFEPRSGLARRPFNVHLLQGRAGVMRTPGGSWEIQLIPAGTYDVRLSSAELGSAWLGDLAIHAGRLAKPGALAFGQGRLEGTTVDGSGKAVGDVTVAIGTSGGEVLYQITSNAEGRFQLERAAAGEWTVFALDMGWKHPVSRAVRVEPGRTTAVTLTVTGQSALEGIVLGPEGPRSAQVLQMTPLENGWYGEPIRSMTTRSDGTFGPVSCLAGSFLISAAVMRGEGEFVKHWRMVELRAGVTANLRLELGSETQVTCSLQGEPLHVVGGIAMFPTGQATLVAEAGTATVELGSGPWVVAVQDRGDLDPASVALHAGYRVAVAGSPGEPPPDQLTVTLTDLNLSVTSSHPELLSSVKCQLVGLTGVDPVSSSGMSIVLRGVESSGSCSFGSIPRGATLLLTGYDQSGVSRSVTIKQVTANRELAWPPE